MFARFDPTTIADTSLRATFQYLMNWAEDLATKLDHALAEIQRLRNETNHLRGEQGQPTILPKRSRTNIASERERAVPHPPSGSIWSGTSPLICYPIGMWRPLPPG